VDQKKIDNVPQKKKLSNEDLMAGKCESDEEADRNKDPRIKSPDELLLRLLSQKKGPSSSVASPATEKAPSDETAAEMEDTGTTIESTLSLKDLQNKKWLVLKEMYDRNLARWKEYEQNVTHWRDKVLQIVQKMQNELAGAKGLKDEVEALKTILKTKDEEIAKLSTAISRFSKNNNSHL